MASYLTKCPCCGQDYESNKPVVVSVDSNKAFYNGKFIKLSAQQTEFLYILAISMPYVTTLDRIACGLWGERTPNDFKNYLSVILNKLRKRIRPHGLEIKAVRNRGYFLQEQNPVRTGAPHTKLATSPPVKEDRGKWTTPLDYLTHFAPAYQAQLTLYGLPNCLGMQVSYSPKTK